MKECMWPTNFIRSLVLFAIVATLSGQTFAEDRDKIMAQKLAASQSILAAITTEDFSMLEKNADVLLALAKQEWLESPTPEYRAHLKDFWLTLEGLSDKARGKNIDGATLGYVHMTLSCVKCHRYLRNSSQ